MGKSTINAFSIAMLNCRRVFYLDSMGFVGIANVVTAKTKKTVHQMGRSICEEVMVFEVAWVPPIFACRISYI